MLGDISGVSKIYCVTRATDMRLSFDCLMAIIWDTYQMDPYANTVYFFCGKRKNTLKALYFDKLSRYRNSVDNGCSCSNEQLFMICVSLDILLLHTKVRDGASKGKVERHFRTLKERWLYTLDMDSITSLAQFNGLLKDYMHSYNTTFHRGIDEIPMERYQASKEQGEKYSNPRITHDRKYWYISVAYEVPEQTCELSEKSLGIDVGVKKLAVCSDRKFYKNINKTKGVRQLEKRLKCEQRKLSRRLLNNIKGYDKQKKPIWIRPLRECKNIQKQNAVIRRLHKKLTDIRTNHIHQATSKIVQTKPSWIVMETLSISGKKSFINKKRRLSY